MKEKTSLLAELETYTALSHCWGREATITTTVSNFRTMKAGFPITALSKTFRDAIEVTRRLQMRYIWIDSLCIIQDDQKDWEIEAARMGTVYANAVLTIAATRSADGRGGCLATTRDMSYIWQPRSHLKSVQESQTIHVRHEDIWSHLHVKSTQFERWFILRPSYDVRYLSRKDASGAIIDAGFPLFTRAWFLQERLLSPRVLHFGHMELFWECRCATWTHCIGPQPLPPPDTQGNQSERIHPDYKSSSGSPTEPEMKKPRPRKESEYPIAKLRTMFSALVSEDSSRTVQRGHSAVFEQSSWNLLIEEYTRLHLTRESDRLPALSGIAAAQEARSEYLAGIWAENLPAGLLWTIDTSTASLARRPVKYRAPSWTWASIDGPIRYRDRLNTTRKDWDIVPPHTGYQVARVHSFSCTPEGLDPHGCVKAGYIDLEGYIGTARVTQLYQEKSNTVCVVTQEGTSRRQKFYLDVPLALCRAEPAEIAQGDTISLLLVECEKLPVSLGYAHGYRVMVLVLRRSISVPVAYERVGLICPADDIALYFSEYTSGAADIGDDTSMFDEASVWFEGKGFVKIV